jgi:Transposase IS66 family
VRQLSRKSELAQAFRYMRARWTALVRCFDDGRLALDNNPAERALRCVAIGRKNYLFAGSDAGGRRDLFADRKRQAQRSQSAALPGRRACPHRRSSGAAHCRTPALELATARRHPRCRLSRPTRRALTSGPTGQMFQRPLPTRPMSRAPTTPQSASSQCQPGCLITK